MTKILGVVLLVAGIAFIIMGAVASRSLADSLSSTFLGRFTERTTWYIVGGIASAVVGVVLTTGGFGRFRS